MSEITTKTAPVGTRLLVRDFGCLRSVREILVLEWSLSGKFIKYKVNCGNEIWDESLPKNGVFVEVLPQKEVK